MVLCVDPSSKGMNPVSCDRLRDHQAAHKKAIRSSNLAPGNFVRDVDGPRQLMLALQPQLGAANAAESSGSPIDDSHPEERLDDHAVKRAALCVAAPDPIAHQGQSGNHDKPSQ